jgi:hypothetical protein
MTNPFQGTLTRSRSATSKNSAMSGTASHLTESGSTSLAGSKPVGTAADLGCGAGGQMGRYLHDREWSVTRRRHFGRIDRRRSVPESRDIVRRRRHAHPAIADVSIYAMVTFYYLIYGSDNELVASLTEATPPPTRRHRHAPRRFRA